MGSFLIGLLGQIASLITGGIGGSISLVTSLIKAGVNSVMQYHKEGIALSRQMGLNAEEAQAYTQVLITRAKELGHQYGIAAEQVLELQKNLSTSTGRALMLNNEEAERMIQINKLVGTQVTNEFTSQMMNHMGAQLSSVQGAVSKAYVTAAKSGLNAAQFSEKVAKNLSLANKLSFRDGVNGIIKMTALSEKLGFNLQSIESAANKFMELDSAIESSAQLQMLGGAAGAYGSNPLTMSYEANYDPEAFTERMTKALAGYATFNTKTGMADVNGMNKDFVRNIAQAMGISMDEAMSIAKKQAEIKYKENAFGATLGNYSTEQRDFILNKSYVDAQSGHLMMTGVNGEAIDISKGELSKDLIKEMQKFDNQSEKDIMKEQSQKLTSIDEQIKGFETSFNATIAEAANQQIGFIQKIINQLGLDAVKELAPILADYVTNGAEWLKAHKDVFKGIYNFMKATILPILKWGSEHIGLLFGLFAGGKFIRMLMQMPWGSGTVGSSLVKSVFGKGGGGGAAARSGGGFFKGLTKIGGKARKLIKVGGGATAAISAIGSSLDVKDVRASMDKLKEELESGRITQEEYNKQYKVLKDKKNEALGSGVGAIVGGAAGSLLDEFLGPFGTMLGAAIGDFLGGIVGKAWNAISNTISDFWTGPFRDFMTEQLGPVGTAVVDSIGDLVDGLTSFLGSHWEAMFGMIGETVGGVWNGIKTTFLMQFKGFGKILRGDLTGIFDIAVAPIHGIWEVGKGIFRGIGTFIENEWRAVCSLFEGYIDSFKDIGDGLIAWVKLTWENSLSKPIDAIIEWHKNIFNAVVIKPLSYVADWLKGKWEGVMNTWDALTVEFRKFVNDPWGYIKNSKVGEAVSNSAKETVNTGMSIMEWTTPVGLGYKMGKMFNNYLNGESHANGGIIGGNSYNGDNVLTRVNSGEMVLNRVQQSDLFNFISDIPNSVLENNNSVKAKPVGEKEYIYIPSRNGGNNGVTEVTVKDINLNINGTLKLNAGTFSKNLDMNQLLSDTTFISSLKDLIKQSINNDINNGRFMNDIASMRGMPSQVGLWGRK